jgi:hypothetical protein
LSYDRLANKKVLLEEKPIEKIKLDNGLTLEIYDHSRPVAGDRWLVSFVARVEVRVKGEYFKGTLTPHIPFEQIRKAVGDKTHYHHEKRRNFIAETEKDAVFRGLKERFLDTNLGYLSSPHFPRKLILSKYQTALGQRICWKQ